MDDPVATCFRIAEIEHDGIVARGSNKAPIGSWRKIPITLIDIFGSEIVRRSSPAACLSLYSLVPHELSISLIVQLFHFEGGL
jgi:hypothetical protein